MSDGKPARELLKLDEDENSLLPEFNLITTKPILYVCNLAENEIKSGNKFTELFVKELLIITLVLQLLVPKLNKSYPFYLKKIE